MPNFRLRRYWPVIPIAVTFAFAVHQEWLNKTTPQPPLYAAAPQIPTLAASAADAQKSPKSLPAPTVRPAIDGILAGFEDRPLVALGNVEDSAQEEDFYAALVRDPRFARDVGNVVVEFGGAAHQDIIDRYLNGQNVSFSDLRKVWTDAVGFNFPVAMGYINFFVQLREVNRTLPSNQRIHVWLGESPINWSKIKTQADYFAVIGGNDAHVANMIENQILSKNKKALVIYGHIHLYYDWGYLHLVEKKYPNAFFTVNVYRGYVTKSCTEKFEQSIQDWSPPVIATPVKGTSLEGRLYRSDCDVVPRNSWKFVGPIWTKAKIQQTIQDNERNLSGVNGDAVLYLGKAATLTQSPFEPSIYLDPNYLREMNRRATLGFGFNVGTAPMTDAIMNSNPMSPQYIHHY